MLGTPEVRWQGFPGSQNRRGEIAVEPSGTILLTAARAAQETEMNSPVPTHDLISLVLNELDAVHAAELTAAIAEDAQLRVRFAAAQSMMETLGEGTLLSPPPATRAKAIAIGTPKESARPLAWLSNTIAVAARIIGDSLTSPSVAGFRGEAEGRHLSCTCGDAQIELLVDERLDARSDRPGIVVHGQVSGVEAAEIAACVPGTATPLGSAPISSNGTFTLHIDAAQSDLVIQTRAGAIRVNGIHAG